jgi:hypothetical protein
MSGSNIQRQTVVINQSLASSNTFTVNIAQGFTPTSVIIRQLLYANITNTDLGTYLIWSSITSDYIGAVYIGIQGVGLMPSTVLPLLSPQQSITFRLDRANAAFNNPTGLLTMVLEFVREQ